MESKQNLEMVFCSFYSKSYGNRTRDLYIFWILTSEIHWNGVTEESVTSDYMDLKLFLLRKRRHKTRSVSLSSTSAAVLPFLCEPVNLSPLSFYCCLLRNWLLLCPKTAQKSSRFISTEHDLNSYLATQWLQK